MKNILKTIIKGFFGSGLIIMGVPVFMIGLAIYAIGIQVITWGFNLAGSMKFIDSIVAWNHSLYWDYVHPYYYDDEEET